MLTIFLKILVIFLMVAIGFVANKKDILPSESNKYLVNLLMVITMPCMIISSSAMRELTSELYHQTFQVLIGSILYFILISVFAFFAVKAIRVCPKSDQGIMMVIITSVNTGFMGFPITLAIFGDKYLFLMIIQNLVLNLYLYTLCIIQINYGDNKKGEFRGMFKSAINLCTIAAFASIIIIFGNIKLPQFTLDLFSMIGSATIPISMFVVGIQLADRNIMGIITNHKLVIVSLINVALVPFLVFLGVNWLPIDIPVKVILIYASAFPTAVVCAGIAAKENKNSFLLAEGVALTTALSIITLPIISYLLINYYQVATL